MFSALKLFFSGILGSIVRAASSALEWVLSDWRHGPLVFFGFGLLAHVFFIDPGLRSDLADLAEARDIALERADAERQARLRTILNYEQAARRAKAEADANAARVRAEQNAITRETIDDYESRLADARARAERLRAQFARTAAGDPGGARATDLPGSGQSAARAAGASEDPGLPAARDGCPAGFACLTLAEALIATEQAVQLDALIAWTELQAAIGFTPEAGRAQ